jgi:Holliday junction resolvasome RuvABC endonuclease subunit
VILSLDPSSSCTGYALLTGPTKHELVDGGIITATPKKAPAIERMRQMARDVAAIITERREQLQSVVIEVPSGKVHRRMWGASKGAGLSTYGMAVGYIMATVEASGVPCVPVFENDWTRQVPKATRIAEVAMVYRGAYDESKDPGGDFADAIALGRWALLRERI